MLSQKSRRYFIILIPHRDALRPFWEYREQLFAAGYLGAFSYPLAVPLASVSMPFSRKELKELALNIRELTKEKDGKIVSSTYDAVPIGTALDVLKYKPGELSFFGPILDLPFNKEIFPLAAVDKILNMFLPLVFCTALASPGEKHNPIAGPTLSFRAASLANLAIKPLPASGTPKEGSAPEKDSQIARYAPAYSFEWQIGAPVWLPKHKG